MDKAAAIEKYGPIRVVVMHGVDLGSGLPYPDCHLVNGVKVTPEEAKTVSILMRPWGDKLTAADFINLGEVEKILDKVQIESSPPSP